MAESRTINTKRNIISGLIRQVLSMILPFVLRTLVLYQLGQEYQGLSGLFSSILSMLSLTDFGFSLAIVYVLYKPIAQGDVPAICAIMAYLKRIYRRVGIAVLLLGLALMPFLPHFVKGIHPKDISIYFTYLIYLANSVISYWLFAYKSALLNAMQRMDIVHSIAALTRVVLNLIQIAVLMLFKNYYAYILLYPVMTVVNNLLIEYFSRKYFPQIIPKGTMRVDLKSDALKQAKGIFINRMADVARNGADNLVLSSLIGLTAVAVYNNYYYIYAVVYRICAVIANSMGASVGNSVAKESKHKNYEDLCMFTFAFSWITGWCTVCMCCLYQPFMTIWMRANASLILPERDAVLFSMYFYAITMCCIRNQYLSGAGLYWELRLWYLLEAVSNIALNLILGYLFGTTGILLASLITVVFFSFIARNTALFTLYFQKPMNGYYAEHIAYAAVTAAVCLVTRGICALVSADGLAALIGKAMLCLIVPNVLYLAIYFKTKRFGQISRFIKRNLLYRAESP